MSIHRSGRSSVSTGFVGFYPMSFVGLAWAGLSIDYRAVPENFVSLGVGEPRYFVHDTRLPLDFLPCVRRRCESVDRDQRSQRSSTGLGLKIRSSDQMRRYFGAQADSLSRPAMRDGDRPIGGGSTELWWRLGVMLIYLLTSAVGIYVVGHLGAMSVHKLMTSACQSWL